VLKAEGLQLTLSFGFNLRFGFRLGVMLGFEFGLSLSLALKLGSGVYVGPGDFSWLVTERHPGHVTNLGHRLRVWPHDVPAAVSRCGSVPGEAVELSRPG
jgi:hypothetical protein